MVKLGLCGSRIVGTGRCIMRKVCVGLATGTRLSLWRSERPTIKRTNRNGLSASVFQAPDSVGCMGWILFDIVRCWRLKPVYVASVVNCQGRKGLVWTITIPLARFAPCSVAGVMLALGV